MEEDLGLLPRSREGALHCVLPRHECTAERRQSVSRIDSVRHEFVESAPRQLEPGILYVSFKYSFVLHACCCGCGREVITPLSPAQWSLTYNGQAITLEPSIGNWSFPCRSHYW